MNKIIFNLLLCLFLVSTVSAQAYKTVFRGNIQGLENIRDAEIIVEFYDDFLLGLSSMTKTIVKEPVDENGGFKIEMDNNAPYLYMQCWVLRNKEKVKELFGRLNDKVYLIRTNEDYSLEINLHNGEVEIMNESMAIINSQYKINSITMPQAMNNRLNELIYKKGYADRLTTSKFFLEQNLRTKICLLESYKDDMDSVAYENILNKTIAEEYYKFTRSLFIKFSVSSLEDKLCLRDFINRGNLEIDSVFAVLMKNKEDAPYYPEYIYERMRLEVLADKYLYKKGGYVEFIDIYQNLDQLEPGRGRDKVILTMFASQAKRNQQTSFSFIETALNKLYDLKYKDLLLNWYNKQNQGVEAYNFSLTDLEGNVYTLENFKGRIILIDFWFTGCHGCTQIPPVMSKIIQYFKNRKDEVAFLSVNVSSKKEYWLAGLTQGVYTTDGQTDLFTNGEGISHPLLRHYNFSSFPQLMLIDKNGKLISANPPDPRKDEGEKIIELIEKNL